ncbi:hypothetical protein A3H85_03180 [Candidatus Daviesbacteria bacterium RIFCSPLOWO2_02_FULL_40_8]|uniref:Protease HtpX homolog n=1 Tax=Candidatus Daviesbacteria bacterium RIFCSPLOWO2_01_FULL_40_24 TaxID=1797787 RepID=A0A1F5MJ09_9BACT|nr:MAG: hypothetical protein A2780_00265 [Candidatus Daviesbacteria bacterium RIFCSPHIGHO2_01_FULL_41_45]OGE34455.1 MAG: hypothetical protein A3C32_03865 [Candidatus Daviesbacteria bacterium RIFCSPHIGHO2_02_FULL_41_14]OGE65367.1 MAG: hypothetical protein A3B49_00560 [Candidatus Daviesbacteria bacterium RIFCSPLOWO2_01_FULL_40_24]OGE66773.1 MAG: hypothetical protein A3H85_03180 [Candidatus Daviesbacteria bacterium RIFCSPLOWO2_02_FULL_40_8]
MTTPQNQISANIFKTWLIMFLFSVFVVGVVYIMAMGLGYDAVGSLGLVGMSFILAGVMNFVSYYFSDKMVLSISAAKEIKKIDHPQLFRSVENLSIAAGLPMPRVYIINDSAPNAFATGRDPQHSAVAFTSGILDKLNKQEIEGVVAHELSHINNRDTLLMTVVSILVGLIALLADWFIRITWYGNRDSEDNRSNALFFAVALLAAILAPIIGTLIQLAISRRREFLADASGAYLTRDPEQLAYALQKIAQDREPLEVANKATAHLYIMNPLKGQKDAIGWFAGLFLTHPPVEARVKALMSMEGQI